MAVIHAMQILAVELMEVYHVWPLSEAVILEKTHPGE
jgi:hypothetical protein